MSGYLYIKYHCDSIVLSSNFIMLFPGVCRWLSFPKNKWHVYLCKTIRSSFYDGIFVYIYTSFPTRIMPAHRSKNILLYIKCSVSPPPTIKKKKEKKCIKKERKTTYLYLEYFRNTIAYNSSLLRVRRSLFMPIILTETDSLFFIDSANEYKSFEPEI